VFANIGWGEMLVLLVVGLVVLGPERLPGAMRWTASALRQARDYLSGVTSQLREDMGPEFDDLRGQLGELQKLRGMTPRAALTKHLLDGDDSFFTGNFEKPTNGAPPKPAEPGQPNDAAQPSPAAGQRAPGNTPFDSDAT
jgi:sec-independent protein translocase protein TatB